MAARSFSAGEYPCLLSKSRKTPDQDGRKKAFRWEKKLGNTQAIYSAGRLACFRRGRSLQTLSSLLVPAPRIWIRRLHREAVLLWCPGQVISTQRQNGCTGKASLTFDIRAKSKPGFRYRMTRGLQILAAAKSSPATTFVSRGSVTTSYPRPQHNSIVLKTRSPSIKALDSNEQPVPRGPLKITRDYCWELARSQGREVRQSFVY